MSPLNFCYWLQGQFELSGSGSLDARQVDIIKQHLALVLKPETEQAKLQVKYMFTDYDGRPFPSC